MTGMSVTHRSIRHLEIQQDDNDGCVRKVNYLSKVGHEE